MADWLSEGIAAAASIRPGPGGAPRLPRRHLLICEDSDWRVWCTGKPGRVVPAGKSGEHCEVCLERAVHAVTDGALERADVTGIPVPLEALHVTPDTPIAELALTLRTRNMLMRGSFRFVRDLPENLEELWDIRGFGTRSRLELAAALTSPSDGQARMVRLDMTVAEAELVAAILAPVTVPGKRAVTLANVRNRLAAGLRVSKD